jgi:hypothetical protein
MKTSSSAFFSPKIQTYDSLSPKHCCKKLPLKSSEKVNTSFKKISGVKKYTLNKTSFVTPYDKSMMLSYVSTPNEKSFNASEKLKKIRYTKRLTSKNKELFHSTED